MSTWKMCGLLLDTLPIEQQFTERADKLLCWYVRPARNTMYAMIKADTISYFENDTLFSSMASSFVYVL